MHAHIVLIFWGDIFQINAEKKLSLGKDDEMEEAVIKKNSKKKGAPVRRLSRPVSQIHFICYTLESSRCFSEGQQPKCL